MVDLTWEEFRDRATSEIVLLPLGAVEQHGPHLPLDTDCVVPNELCLAVASRVPAMVAPTFAYGYKSQPSTGGGELFPGTTSFDGATLTACVRAIAIVNGNYENTYFAIEGIDLALRDARLGDAAKVLHVNWWEQLTAAELDDVFAGAFPGWEAEHASLVETSLMLHLAADRVRLDRIPAPSRQALITYTVLPERPGLVPATGVLASAQGATPETGAVLFERLSASIATIFEHEFVR
jgi:creatinine amidohydrolase